MSNLKSSQKVRIVSTKWSDYMFANQFCQTRERINCELKGCALNLLVSYLENRT